MAKAPTRGRASIFRGKDDGVRVQGIITKIGGQRFEAKRKELSELYSMVVGHKPPTVSDADIIEFLARGRDETITYLRRELMKYIV